MVYSSLGKRFFICGQQLKQFSPASFVDTRPASFPATANGAGFSFCAEFSPLKKETELTGFKKWVGNGSGKNSWLSLLEVGECWAVIGTNPKNRQWYNRIYRQQERTGKEFSYLQIKNAVIVKREK